MVLDPRVIRWVPVHEADAETSVVGVEFRGGVGPLEVEVEERLAGGRAVMLGLMSRRSTIPKDGETSRSLF